MDIHVHKCTHQHRCIKEMREDIQDWWCSIWVMNQLLSVFKSSFHLLFKHRPICWVCNNRQSLSALLTKKSSSNKQRFSSGCWTVLKVWPGTPTSTIIGIALDSLESPSKIANIGLQIIVMVLLMRANQSHTKTNKKIYTTKNGTKECIFGTTVTTCINYRDVAFQR